MGCGSRCDPTVWTIEEDTLLLISFFIFCSRVILAFWIRAALLLCLALKIKFLVSRCHFFFFQLPLQDSCHIVSQTVGQIRPQQHTPLFLISAVDLSLRFCFYVDSNEPWLSPPTATVIHVFASFSALGIKSSWWISTVWINQLSSYKSFWWNDKKRAFFGGRIHQMHHRTLL